MKTLKIEVTDEQAEQIREMLKPEPIKVGAKDLKVGQCFEINGCTGMIMDNTASLLEHNPNYKHYIPFIRFPDLKLDAMSPVAEVIILKSPKIEFGEKE